MRSWLMVEHQGAWSADVADRLFAAALPPHRQRVLGELRRRARLRPLLIRRPGVRVGPPGNRSGVRTVFVGGVGSGRRWLERLEIGDPRELADLDLTAIAAGRGRL